MLKTHSSFILTSYVDTMDCVDGLIPSLNNNDSMKGSEPTCQLSKGTQATQIHDDVPNDVIDIAKALAMDLVHHVTNNNSCKSQRSILKYSKTLKRTVNELLEKHSILFNGMVSKLNISEKNGYQTFHNVADEIFVDGQFNWGRIVAVYAFGARIAKYCVENNMENYVDEIGGFLGSYVANKLGAWISRNGGWVGAIHFLKCFLFTIFVYKSSSKCTFGICTDFDNNMKIDISHKTASNK